MRSTILKISLFVGLLLSVSCADKLEVTPPNNIIDEDIQTILNGSDTTKIQKVLNAIANPMIQWFNVNSQYGGMGGLDYTGNTQQSINWMHCLQGNDAALGRDVSDYNHLRGSRIYRFEVDYRSKDNGVNYEIWCKSAAAVNKANQLLFYLTAEAAEKNNSIKDGRARGLLVRANALMIAMDEYQDAYLLGGKDKLGLSLYTEYNPLQEDKARSTSQETYDFIKKDINEAINLLKGASIGYTKNSTEDFDLGIANFLLARISLITGDYANCISACNDIINNSGLTLITEDMYGGKNTGKSWAADDIEIFPETNAFLDVQKNTECILGYNRKSTYNGSTHLNALTNPFANSSSYVRVDDRFYALIDPNDFRQDCFKMDGAIGDYTTSSGSTGSIPNEVPLKFANTHGLNDDGNNHTTIADVGKVEYCHFRLAEVYLMLAEAQLASGNEGEAKATIDKLLAARTRKGATPLTCDTYSTTVGKSTLEKIQIQWRIEMWGERGIEYFNNKRWGINVDRTGSAVHASAGGAVSWPANKMTLAIPNREMEDNPLAVQNDLP